ncbi:MAG: hypothetical protein ACTSPT_08625 [Candidatus Heimdallarchaeota archaeon]
MTTISLGIIRERIRRIDSRPLRQEDTKRTLTDRRAKKRLAELNQKKSLNLLLIVKYLKENS